MRQTNFNIPIELTQLAQPFKLEEVTYEGEFKSRVVNFGITNENIIVLGYKDGYYPALDELIREGLIDINETKFTYNNKTHIIEGEYKTFKFKVGECYNTQSNFKNQFKLNPCIAKKLHKTYDKW